MNTARTFVIGDIHGAAKALEQVLERAAVTPEDTLIFLGDYVDGWSDSAKVIARLIALKQQHHCIFVRGNHDTWCAQWLASGTTDSTWLKHGGKSTMAAYANLDSAEKDAHITFFSQLSDYYEDTNNCLFIHAGFTSMHGPSQEVHTSNYSWDRTLWEVARTMDERLLTHPELYPKRLLLYNEIFIGHTPTLHYGTDQPIHAANVWNMDTGAGFSGKLTILDVSTKMFWQSDPVRTLYPDETGRN